ncbi:phage scaffolding protein [Clostridium estertheticum]|uniref:phage scaffolding protein n=1 Tax=Clostridium estertheticum TaxID=238834 RepID=UPI001C0B911F|nr:phage scaffolding protein [Clostridium estertheticum]MBU3171362.1 phage scaffolding protein [Clostridium estertheticum]MBU3185650.1 phage scaffolding protein [Clostridium estertheticum]
MGLLEYLKKILGDTEGQTSFDKIQADKENQLLVNPIKEPKYVDKTILDAANNSVTQYKKDVAKRDKDLLDLQGKVKDNSELTTEIENLKTANLKASTEYEAKLTQMNFDGKFEKALGTYKPKNSKALKALLDMEKVKLDGEAFLGLEDQVKLLKESDPYLFSEENLGGTGSLGGGVAGTLGGTEGQEGGLGSRLAKEKAEAVKATESQNTFFK